jgi:hypothetical protein
VRQAGEQAGGLAGLVLYLYGSKKGRRDKQPAPGQQAWGAFRPAACMTGLEVRWHADCGVVLHAKNCEGKGAAG